MTNWTKLSKNNVLGNSFGLHLWRLKSKKLFFDFRHLIGVWGPKRWSSAPSGDKIDIIAKKVTFWGKNSHIHTPISQNCSTRGRTYTGVFFSSISIRIYQEKIKLCTRKGTLLNYIRFLLIALIRVNNYPWSIFNITKRIQIVKTILIMKNRLLNKIHLRYLNGRKTINLEFFSNF